MGPIPNDYGVVGVF